MPATTKDLALSQLKEMQGEITAIRYYNKKLSEIKKNIDSATPDPSAYVFNRASELKRQKADALRSAKEPTASAHPLDLLLFIPFALFAIILMAILYPVGIADLLGGVINWIFQIYFVLYPVFIVSRQLVPTVAEFAKNSSRGLLIALLSIYGVSVIFVLIAVFFRPLFMLCIVPLVFGVIALILKDKENEKLDIAKHNANIRKMLAEYDKRIREAELSDAEENARYNADGQNSKKEVEAKYAEVIKECKAALLKHKAKFKEVKVIPDSLMQKDMNVVDKLIAIIERGEANSIDSAIEVYEAEQSEAIEHSGEIYVYVGIRRKDGWSAARNLVYLDGEKCCSAEMPYSVINVTPGEHTISAKVQLNYGGASHYPESEIITLSIDNGEKQYVKFYVKGSPDVKVRVCNSTDEFGIDD